MDERHQAPTGVFLVDDHAVVRVGLRALFDKLADIHVVGEAANGREALVSLRNLAKRGQLPDVVLMDLVMPGAPDGVGVTSRIKESYPAVEVVVVTSYSEAERIHSALQAGAAGYVLKGTDVDQLASAVRAAARGQVHLDDAVATILTRSLVTKNMSKQSLSAREREVLSLLAQGETNRGIAKLLNISDRTVQTHISSLLAKLGLKSRTQAALWAVQEGITVSQVGHRGTE